MLDWENSHHFAMQPLASQQNIASEEWLQIILFYIDEVTFPYLGSYLSSEYRISTVISQMSLCRQTSGSIIKC